MSAPQYQCSTEGAVALVATTAKHVLGVKGHANSGLLLAEYELGFDGVTATDAAVLCELCYVTFATNAPGTNSTSTTPRQLGGRALAAGFISGKSWTVVPTVITVLEEFLLTPQGGLIRTVYPFGAEPDAALGEGFTLRCTAPTNAVNVRGAMRVSRC